MSLKEQLLQELPRLLREDPALRQAVLDLVRPYFADREVTEGRFEVLLEELRRMREEGERRWQEHLEEERRRWEEWERRWQEHLEEERRRWEEWEQRWEQHMAQWEAHLEEERRNWAEYRQTIQRLQTDIRALDHRIRTVLGSIGSRWGRRTEGTFRNAIIGILQEYVPEVQVERILFRDERGEVFGYPSDIELDLFIHNGRRILGEIKSSMSQADVYAFVRKVRLYESLTGEQADQLIVISPMMEPKALELAERLGVQVYTFPDEAQEVFQA